MSSSTTAAEFFAREEQQSGAPRRMTARVAAALCGIWLFIIAGVWVLLRLAGDRWWGASLLLFAPRWVWTAPVAVILPLVLARRPRLAWLPLAIALLASIILGDFRWSIGRADHVQSHLRLLTCNVHRQKLDAPKLAELIAALRPDVVALQDWSARHQQALFGQGVWHLRRDGELLLASRHPIARAAALRLSDVPGSPGGRRGSAAHYELVTPHGTVHVINVHLASPHSGLVSVIEDGGRRLRANMARRWLESRAVREAACSLSGPVVVAGDFNTMAESAIYRAHWSDLANAFAQCGYGFGHTYITRPTQLRIDHVLVAGGGRGVRCWVGSSVGSPHRPLVADLRWP